MPLGQGWLLSHDTHRWLWLDCCTSPCADPLWSNPPGLKARPIHDAAFFDKDGGKPILRKFEKHRLHYPLVHFSSDNEPAITPQLTKAEGVFVIHGTRGKSYAIEYHTGDNEWQPFETVTLHSNKQLYIDPESATGTRIYRARVAD